MEADRVLEPTNMTSERQPQHQNRNHQHHHQQQQQQQQHDKMGSAGGTNSLDNHWEAPCLADADSPNIRGKLLKLQENEERGQQLLCRIFETSSVVREGIPGGQSPGDGAETRMLDLRCQMNKVGPSPATVVNAFDSMQTPHEAGGVKTFVAFERVAHDSCDGKNGGSSMDGGRRANTTVDNGHWSKRTLPACEARGELLDSVIKDALREFRALVAEADCLDAEAEAFKEAYARDAPCSAVPGWSADRDVHDNWYLGREYQKFVDKTRRLFEEDSDELFVATQVISQQHRSQEGTDVSGVWAKPAGKLGSGTFGTVNRLDVPTLGTSFAAKEANTAYGGGGGEDSWVSRQCGISLVTEMAIHASMEPHPNIAQLVGVDDRDVHKMLVLLELADGDFHSYAVGLEIASVGVLMRLLADVARGLEYLGQHGYGHNDVKPGNVLVYKEFGVLVAKITDLGCALCFGETKQGEGTIGGRPPEGTLSRKYPCQASQDVFALGHMVLLTFTKPELKNSNMWVSEAVLTAQDKRICAALSEASRRKYLEDVVTPRNQLDPRARATLLKLEHLEDSLGNDVKERIVDLLVRALSPDPNKRPAMSAMFKELSALDGHLLKTETQRAVPAGSATTSAIASAVTSAATSAAAVDTEGGRVSLISCAATDGSVQAASRLVPAAPGVSSRGQAWSRDAAVPEIGAAVAAAATPSAGSPPVASTRGVVGDAGRGDGGERHYNGVQLAALALWPSALHESFAASPAHSEGSGGYRSNGGGSYVPHMPGGGEITRVESTAAGGSPQWASGNIGVGSGVVMPTTATEVAVTSQAPTPEPPTIFLPPPCSSGRHEGRPGMRGVERIPRAVLMDVATHSMQNQTVVAGVRGSGRCGGDCGDDRGDGRYTPYGDPLREPGADLKQDIDRVLDAAGDAAHSFQAAGVSQRGAARKSIHKQQRHHEARAGRQQRVKRKKGRTGGRTGGRREAALSPDPSFPSPQYHHYYHHHHHHHPYHHPGAFQSHHNPVHPVNNGMSPPPWAQPHWSWYGGEDLAAAVPCYPPGPSAWPQQMSQYPTQTPSLAPPPPPPPPLQPTVHHDPWYVSSGFGGVGTTTPAPGIVPPLPWGPFCPFPPSSVASGNWAQGGQAACLVR